MTARRLARIALIVVLATLASVFVAPRVFAAPVQGPQPVATHWQWTGNKDVYPVLYVDSSDVKKWKGFRANAIVGLASPICEGIPTPKVPVIGKRLRQVAFASCLVLFQYYGWRVQEVMQRAWDSGRCVRIEVYSPFAFGTSTTRCVWR